jgi:hypothetical protein
MHTRHEVNFTTDVEGLDQARSSEVVRLRDGQSHEIEIKPVRKRSGDAEVRMLGYNGSIPGPTLHVDQNSEVTIEATNLGDSSPFSRASAFRKACRPWSRQRGASHSVAGAPPASVRPNPLRRTYP